MAGHREVFTDVRQGIWQDTCVLTPETVPPSAGSSGAAGWRVRKWTLRGGLSDGVDVVELDNGALCTRILPTRGMGIWQAELQGVPVGWQSPVALPVHPSAVNLHDRNGLGWLQGFNELLCRCGLAWHGPPGTDVCGTPLTLHGRIANLPAHYVDVHIDGDVLAVTGHVDEASMFGARLRLESTLSTRVGTHAVQIRDVVTNLGGQSAEFEMLYHTNVGPPFLGAGSRLHAAAREVIPRDARAVEGVSEWTEYGGPEPGFAEQAYFLELQTGSEAQTRVLLRDASGEHGVSVAFSRDQLPCFTLWKNTQAVEDGYVTGLEPGTSLPNVRAFEREQQRLITLAPGASYCCELELAVHVGREAVAAAEDEIAGLNVHPCVVHSETHARYSPG